MIYGKEEAELRIDFIVHNRHREEGICHLETTIWRRQICHLEMTVWRRQSKPVFRAPFFEFDVLIPFAGVRIGSTSMHDSNSPLPLKNFLPNVQTYFFNQASSKALMSELGPSRRKVKGFWERGIGASTSKEGRHMQRMKRRDELGKGKEDSE
jgi:hypothetical protein